jgi:ADP-ribose pyrophosphatase YjhB (NUDIX family)
MKIIGIINEYNLSDRQIEKLRIYRKVRGLLFKRKDTLVCVEEDSHNLRNLLVLPGGTVDNGESSIKAFQREILEETGCLMKEIKVLGVMKVIKKRYLSYTICYVAKINRKRKKLNLTIEEIKNKTRPVEIKIEMAIKRIQKEYNKSPNDYSLRFLMILKYFFNHPKIQIPSINT